MTGLFGDMFDLNHDGELDSFERATELAAFSRIMDDDLLEEEKKLEQDDFEFMDEEERREAIEDAGLDFDDFDL